MKIVIGTEDGKKLSKTHFGMSPIFVIYEVLNGEVKSVEKLENSVLGEHKHAEADDILNILGDNEVFIGKSMGRGSVPALIEHGIIPYLTTLGNADEVIEKLLNGEMEYFMEFDQDQQRFIPCKAKKEVEK